MIAVVTDSTGYLPAGMAEQAGLIVVPLQVAVAGRAADENELTTSGVAGALREWRPVTTSRPSPERFAAAYKEAVAAGATAIVSVHLSAAMSGTVDAARLAAQDSPIPVHVVDTGTLGMGLGFCALTAAAAAAAGADPAEVAAAAMRRAELSRSLFYVDTLEHLRRGGRLGAAATIVGTALMVKPLLGIEDGRIAPLEKVRTASRAIARLEELAVEQARSPHGGARTLEVGVQHLAADARAEALADRLRARLPEAEHVYVCEVGPVVGAHVGPGMIGLVVAPAVDTFG